jgi:hypothetical protein
MGRVVLDAIPDASVGPNTDRRVNLTADGMPSPEHELVPRELAKAAPILKRRMIQAWLRN